MNVSSVDSETCSRCADGLDFSPAPSSSESSRLMRAEEKASSRKSVSLRAASASIRRSPSGVVRDGKRRRTRRRVGPEECARLCREEGKSTSMMDENGECPAASPATHASCQTLTRLSIGASRRSARGTAPGEDAHGTARAARTGPSGGAACSPSMARNATPAESQTA